MKFLKKLFSSSPQPQRNNLTIAIGFEKLKKLTEYKFSPNQDNLQDSK